MTKEYGVKRFQIVRRGATPQHAFEEAVGDAQVEHGTATYTGTIAEKVTCKFAGGLCLTLGEAWSSARRILDANDSEFAETDGPAGYFLLDDGAYFFFGVADWVTGED